MSGHNTFKFLKMDMLRFLKRNIRKYLILLSSLVFGITNSCGKAKKFRYLYQPNGKKWCYTFPDTLMQRFNGNEVIRQNKGMDRIIVFYEDYRVKDFAVDYDIHGISYTQNAEISNWTPEGIDTILLNGKPYRIISLSDSVFSYTTPTQDTVTATFCEEKYLNPDSDEYW